MIKRGDRVELVSTKNEKLLAGDRGDVFAVLNGKIHVHWDRLDEMRPVHPGAGDNLRLVRP